MSISENHRLGVRRILLSAAIAALPTIGAWGQPAEPPAVPRGGLNPDAFYGKESFQGVSVRDSLEAIKKLEDARRMERLKDWNKAADWYQEVIEKYGDRVVPSGTDAKNNIFQYTGIEVRVHEMLAKWPKEGLDTYMNRYGAIASSMLEKAGQGDQETLSRIMKLYFVTEAGKQAALRLAELHLENGNFPEAARIADRLLEWHPLVQVERPRILFRSALAYHLAGDAAKAKQRAGQLASKQPDNDGGLFGKGVVPAEATGTLFGKDVVLSEALAQLMASAPPVAIAVGTHSVRLSPGGNEERSQVSSGTGRPGAPMARIEFSPPPIRGAAGAGAAVTSRRVAFNPDGSQVTAPDASAGMNANLGVIPSVDNGELYFQDGSRVYAVSLASGVPLPGWMQSYPSANGQYTVQQWSAARNQQHTVSLTDTSVLAIMGTGDRAAQYGGRAGTDTGTRVVCLSRADGKERWVAKPGMMRVPDDQQAIKSLDFSGSPLVVGDNVYVIGRGGKNPASEDCYVICLDLATGAYKWSSFVASSNGGNMYMYGQQPNSDTLSHLAYSSGRVYCLTNLGAVAAVDAYAGTIVWLNIYPRDNAQAMDQMGGGFRRMAYPGGSSGGTKAWEFNPVVVSEGKVFLLPTDGRKHLLVYDAGSGAELKRIPIDRLEDDAQEANTPRRGPLVLTSIIGVDGNQVFMTGGNYLYAIDWTKYDPAKPKTGSMAASEGGCRLWTHEAAREVPGRGYQANLVTGRGFVTADAVFLCTQTNLRWFSRKTGKIQAGYPGRDADGRDRTWDETVEGPGSVLVTGDHVIVASKKAVSVYADMTLARKRLDDDVAANPTSPEPRLRYAEVMFVAGKLDVAMDKLKETVQLLGGLKALRSGPERDHLFNDCLTFAIKLQKDKRQENIEQTLDMVNALYDLAAAAADGDSQQVNYRVSRAKFNVDYKQDGSYEAAVRLYQEILTSARLRTVPLADADAGGATQAALLAEKNIADIKKREPSAYASFEKEAVDRLVTAGADPAALKLVAESYPNSNAAGKAMAAAAAAYEERGDFRLAAHTFGLVARKYGDGQDRTRLLEGMARNYLAMPDRTGDRVDTAAGRLAAVVTKLGTGSEKLAKPLKLADGQMLVDAGVTFGQALKAVQGHRSRVATAKLPDFRMIPGPTEDVLEAYNKATQEWIKSEGPVEKRPTPPNYPKDAFVAVAERPVVENVDAIVSTPLELRRAHARHDRVIVWSNGALAAFGVGQTKAAATSDALGAAPSALAWLDGGATLAAWTGTDLVLLDGETLAKKWAVNLRGLPRIDVVAGGGGNEETIANANNELDEQMLNGGINARRAMLIRGGRVRFAGGVQPGAPGQAPGPEQIVLVKPVSDRLIVATSAGQVFAVNTSTGQLAWHTRVAQSSAVERLLANEDFVVVKVTDAATTQLVAIDTLTGQLVRRLSFPNDSGNVPVNLALAPDGMLVWTQVDRMCGKDLFETRRELTFEVVAGLDDRKPNQPVNVNVDGQPMNPIYAGATQFDQLVISEGRVLAVTDNGRYVSAHSLESGKLLDYTNKEGRSEKFRLSTVASSGSKQAAAPTDWSVSLNVVGQMLYVTTRQAGPVAYNLDNPRDAWDGAIDVNTAPNLLYQEAMIGQDFFVVLGQPARKGGVAAVPGGGGGGNPNVPVPVVVPANAPGAGAGKLGVTSTTFRVNAYSRVITKKGTESGRLEHSLSLRDDAGITDWEAVEGGLYYLGADKRLHFLKGGRVDAKPEAKADGKPAEAAK